MASFTLSATSSDRHEITLITQQTVSNSWIAERKQDFLRLADVCEHALAENSHLRSELELAHRRIADLEAQLVWRSQKSTTNGDALKSPMIVEGSLPEDELAASVSSSGSAEGGIQSRSIGLQTSAPITPMKDLRISECKLCSNARYVGKYAGDSLRRHMRRQHPEAIASSSSSSTNGGKSPLEEMKSDELEASTSTIVAKSKLACGVCESTFMSRQSLREHQNSHFGTKPFKCDVCPLGFARRWSLTTHKRSHSDAKPFACKECGVRFKWKKSLSYHRRVHTRDKVITDDSGLSSPMVDDSLYLNDVGTVGGTFADFANPDHPLGVVKYEYPQSEAL